MRHVAVALLGLLVAAAALAADLGRADGSLTMDNTRIDLVYAYAVGHQRNDTTKRKDDTKIVLTDKPLAAGTNVNDVEVTLPPDVYAMIFNVSSKGKVTHVGILYPKGSYDAGFLEDMPDFHFRSGGGSRDVIGGHISSSRVQTNTFAFSVDSDFNANVQ